MISALDATGRLAGASWTDWTVQVRLIVTDERLLEPARAIVRAQMVEVEAAVSRFRPDAEIRQVLPDTPTTISPLCAELLAAGLTAARATCGRVDPTLGAVLVSLGYGPSGDAASPRVPVTRSADWRDILLDDGGRSVRIPAGVELDLGATAKAWTADRCAERIVEQLGCDVLVGLGGDIATAAVDPGNAYPFQVAVADVAGDPVTQVSLPGPSGLATSSTRRRTWTAEGRRHHHLIDPLTCLPVSGPWVSISVAARTCLAANTAATAALVAGTAAIDWLAGTGLPARLLGRDGTVRTLSDWPQEREL